jgi:hypothetical protein
MFIKNYLSKIAMVGVLCLAFLTQPAQAYAYWRGGWGWGWGWPVVGAVALGAAATTVWIANHPYYYSNGYYYNYTPQGYVVVNPPQVTVTEASDDVITVNIPNGRGGYSAVVIKRSGKGFVGPQGEFYSGFPKVSQLRIMYGK